MYILFCCDTFKFLIRCNHCHTFFVNDHSLKCLHIKSFSQDKQWKNLKSTETFFFSVGFANANIYQDYYVNLVSSVHILISSILTEACISAKYICWIAIPMFLTFSIQRRYNTMALRIVLVNIVFVLFKCWKLHQQIEICYICNWVSIYFWNQTMFSRQKVPPNPFENEAFFAIYVHWWRAKASHFYTVFHANFIFHQNFYVKSVWVELE